MAAKNLNPELVAKMLADLEAMRTKDPESFLNIIQAAGIPQVPTAAPPGEGDTSPQVTDEQLMAFAQMLQAMQEGGEGGGLEMPGGKGSLGPKGMESKVCHSCCSGFSYADSLFRIIYSHLANMCNRCRGSWSRRGQRTSIL